MNSVDAAAFAGLFREAYEKCFGYPLKEPLSETESKLLSNQILEQTGLTIGWKSLKNYSFYLHQASPGKQENPSVATLDTLARYVGNAPHSTEIQRKNNESHYPYWFQYKDQFRKPASEMVSVNPLKKKRIPKRSFLIAGIAVAVMLTIGFVLLQLQKPESITDTFQSVAENDLRSRGWFVQAKDSVYWQKRGEKAGYLALFTLKGDNWPHPSVKPVIQNLLLRKMPGGCFIMEAHLKDFVPQHNWQQAGIILLEDTNFTGKSIRLSLAYNDFFGGYAKPKEILVQAITSLGKEFGKPEEIVHQPLFSIPSGEDMPVITKNLEYSALRIEKHGKKFRFLYSYSSMKNASFKEVISHEFDMEPRYVGLFALKGFVDTTSTIPAYFHYFQLVSNPCSP